MLLGLASSVRRRAETTGAGPADAGRGVADAGTGSLALASTLGTAADPVASDAAPESAGLGACRVQGNAASTARSVSRASAQPPRRAARRLRPLGGTDVFSLQEAAVSAMASVL